jgi:hypothetical protein
VKPLRLAAIFALIFLTHPSLRAAQSPVKQPPGQTQTGDNKGLPPAEDISGMYTFLNEGEFVQIVIEAHEVSGYISRLGDQETDRGMFLDHFFSQATVSGHDVAFTTRKVHGVWFEFQGRFERGPAKTKSSDGYYILRGTLKQFTSDADQKAVSRSREVEFKYMAQPDENEDQGAPKKDSTRK